MNDNDTAPNEALRAHVTGQAFVLTLGKTHIAALARIAEGGPLGADSGMRNLAYSTTSFFVPATKGLGERGLVVHRHAPNFRGERLGGREDKLSDYFRLTKAGWAVFDLLAEAGLVQALDKRSPKRRLVA